MRLRWRRVDEMLPVSWVHRDEGGLYGLKQRAHALGVAVEVVLGPSAPDEDRWTNARTCQVLPWRSEWDLVLVDDEEGFAVDERDIQLARLAATVH